MHIHIHSLIHFAGLIHFLRLAHFARMGSTIRMLGATLLMLQFSLLHFVLEKPAWAASANNHPVVAVLHEDSTANSGPASGARYRAVDPRDPALSYAISKNAFSSIVYRLKPRIVMIPRMNRTPKPKSVYRCFTRAPGTGQWCQA